MVRTEKTVDERRQTAGDAAVDGLLAGAAAGIAMAVYLVVAGLLAGEGPASVFARFDPRRRGTADRSRDTPGGVSSLRVAVRPHLPADRSGPAGGRTGAR